MFIFKSKYKRLLNDLEHREKSICDQHKMLLRQGIELANKDKQIAELKDALRSAKDLKSIVEALYPLTAAFGYSIGSNGKISVDLPENVVRVVPDYFGGQVMSHEANKVVILDSKGSVKKVALTKKKCDTGYDYVLVREKLEVKK